ncbi:MAG: pyridoxal phosphate-dependent aminotransferase [Pseudobdellovibrionaceae bacterium]|nr:pyridoxal phosphate-dependent aminotransferase [Bdellovibrionales bacterium]USN46440.1 MAG: pyridoxal phosphate-dependent aminotransferase [Pseudobdellovibrionaceae bacterium]
MIKLSQRVSELKPSPTLALAAKAKELKAQGNDVISLSVGEPDWDTFDSVKKAAKQAIDDGITKYTPANGTPELRQAICDQTNSDLGTKYGPNDVTVSTGGKFIIFAALQSVVDPGDEVVIPAPYWVSYPTMVELAGGVPVIAQTKKQDRFKLTADGLKQVLTSKTKAVILNTPSNPTGEVYTAEELDAVAKVLREHPNVCVLSDDIYNRLVFNESGLAPHLLKQAPDLLDRTLVINGVAKTYSMTGWRVGWALGPQEVIKAMTKYQSQSVSCACSIAQQAALVAIRDGQPEVQAALKKLKERRDLVYSKVSQLPHVSVEAPEGAFYIWPDFSYYLGRAWKGKQLATSSDLAAAILEDQMVAAVPGIEFGEEGYLRISYALSPQRMEEAIGRIAQFLNQL